MALQSSYSRENTPSQAKGMPFFGALCLVTSTAFLLSNLAESWATKIPVPGASTGVLTAVSLVSTALLKGVLPGHAYSQCMVASKPLARFLLNVFFAAIGASARFADIAGIGTPILGLTGFALAAHCGMLFLLVKITNAAFRCEISLHQLLVASNANIGGPSTAATFASSIQRDELVMPATLVGTAGYAVATSLGVCFATLAKKFILRD